MNYRAVLVQWRETINVLIPKPLQPHHQQPRRTPSSVMIKYPRTKNSLSTKHARAKRASTEKESGKRKKKQRHWDTVRWIQTHMTTNKLRVSSVYLSVLQNFVLHFFRKIFAKINFKENHILYAFALHVLVLQQKPQNYACPTLFVCVDHFKII